MHRVEARPWPATRAAGCHACRCACCSRASLHARHLVHRPHPAPCAHGAALNRRPHRAGHSRGLEPAVGSGACWLSLQGPSGRPRLHPRACSTRGLCVQAEGLRCAALPAKAGGCPLQRCLTRPLPLVATRAHRLFGGQAADSDGFTTPPRRLEALSSHAESFQARTHELSDPVKHVEGST